MLHIEHITLDQSFSEFAIQPRAVSYYAHFSRINHWSMRGQTNQNTSCFNDASESTIDLQYYSAMIICDFSCSNWYYQWLRTV